MLKNDDNSLQLSIKILSYLFNNNQLIKGSVLSEKFNLSPRSIRRIISDLRTVGYDIESVSGSHGGYRLNRSSIILPIRITESERLNWQNVLNTISSSDINNKEAVIQLLNMISIQSQLQTSFTPDIYSTKVLTAEAKDTINHVQAVLSEAMSKKQRVEIKYLDSDWREFRPQQFQIFNQIPYIKGYYDLNSSSFRILRLSRFRDIRIIKAKYSFNENFEVDNNKSAFSKNVYQEYAVKLKLSKNDPDILDYVYGENQVVVEALDHYLVSFTLAGDQIIKQLVYSLGVNCELLEPQSIREDLKREYAQLNAIYKEEL